MVQFTVYTTPGKLAKLDLELAAADAAVLIASNV
jgi:hypothetical protein